MLKFTLVIPNLNSGATLERALQSVLHQNYPNLQLIMADGGSQDESQAIIRRYRQRFDPLIQKPDQGQAHALNQAFRSAHGDIYGWLCADDELLRGSLEHVRGIFEAHPEIDVVVGASERIFEDGSQERLHVRPDAWDLMPVRNSFDQPSVFWRARLHRRVGELDQQFDLAFDWDFWCRMKAAGARLHITDRVLARYHFTKDSKTSNGGSHHVRESFRIIHRYGPFRGALAHLYRFLYEKFDMHGCLDQPVSCSQTRLWLFRLTCLAIDCSIGSQWLHRYNWHFASLQERKLKWWQ